MTQPDSTRTLLAVFAHPDDESFISGGTLARYAADGVNVDLVCATRGEIGEIADPALATPETLPEVRASELQTAADALGVRELVFLGYRDSGMAGTADNDNPEAFIQASEEDVVSKLVEIMRRIRPQVVLTFDPEGGYGHPDHIAISRYALLACKASGDPGRFAEQGSPWQPSRLFYGVFTRGRMQELRDQMEALGHDTSRYDRRLAEGRGWPDENVHVTLDVSATVDAKWKALRSHRTQEGTFTAFRDMPESVAKRFLSRESFALAWPEPSSGAHFSELFDGV